MRAVEFAAYDNMKKMEQEKFSRAAAPGVKPGDRGQSQSFKVRKAKVEAVTATISPTSSASARLDGGSSSTRYSAAQVKQV